MDNLIALNKCESYDVNEITSTLENQLSVLKINLADFKDKNVLVKPNLLMKVAPDKATTTHPAVVESVCRILKNSGANVVIADSCGGLYTESTLKGLYRACGIEKIAINTNSKLNFDVSSEEIHTPNAKKSKIYNIITPVCKSDYIFNVCKLKTHSFAIMSAAVKNFFGVIPGIEKFEMHARFKNPNDFFGMLVDLCKVVCEMKPVINIVDGIVGMEGNGPSGGNPRKVGCIITGKNPYAVDSVCEYIIGLENKVPTVSISKKLGYFSNLEILGEDIESFKIDDYKKPETSVNRIFKFIPGFLKPRPKINKKKCLGCSDCERSCPEKIIKIIDKKAKIDSKKCIKCYCCQELCKYKAVKIKKNFIFRIIK